jgi:hypothetical protein
MGEIGKVWEALKTATFKKDSKRENLQALDGAGFQVQR